MPAKTRTKATAGDPVDSRRIVNVNPERVTDVSSTDFPGHYPDEDHTWNLQKFKKNLQVRVTRLSNRSVEFDLVGVDASIANAFRRIMIAEVPTICIEHVYVQNNTSIVHDEVLAQRLGLVPLTADPDLFEMRSSPHGIATDRNTLVFRLKVACTRNTAAPPGTTDPDLLYHHSVVTAGDLVWEPQGEQAELPAFRARPPAPTNPEIVLAKLRPGQEMELELHAIKGVGKEHAKWSPVATASYRLMPHIRLDPEYPVPPHLAAQFAACFSPGVIKVDPRTRAVSVDPQAVRSETMSREVFRHPEFEGCVKLGRVRDWFLFSVESEGPYAPEHIFPAAVHVMREKLAVLRSAAQALLLPDDDGQVEGAHPVVVSQDLHSGDVRTQGSGSGDVDGDVVMMDS